MQVTRVTSCDEIVSVEFDDGHRAEFEPYSHGYGYQPEGLRHFRLFHGDREVVLYNSRLSRGGPSNNWHKLVLADEAYPNELIMDYWRTAREYVDEEYQLKPRKEGREGPAELWFPWIVIGHGWLDFEFFEEGRIERPTPASS